MTGKVRIPAVLTNLLVDIEQVRPHPKNANNGDIDTIADSLLANGMFRPIVVQKSTGYILAGNHTYHAMMMLDEVRIPAYYLDVDDTQALKIMLADNRTAQLARMDDGLLIGLLQELGATDAATLYGTGYSNDDLLDLLRAADRPLHPFAAIDGESRVTPTPDDALDAYRENATRSLVLTYRLDEWEPLAALLREARDEHGADNNAVAILAVLAAAYPAIAEESQLALSPN